MKKIIAFMLAVVMLCFVTVVSPSALAGNKKFPQNTYEYLSEHEDTDVLSVGIEIYTGIKVMDRWEYYWRNGIDMSLFSVDEEYSKESYNKYAQYRAEVEQQNVAIMENFIYNKFKATEDTIRGFNGITCGVGAHMTVSEIKRLESFDEVLGVVIYTPGTDFPFHGKAEEFSTEIYNEEYLLNSTNELVPIEFYGYDELYALFRGGMKESDKKCEIILDGFLIIGSPYTHSADNPTGLFVTTESGIIRTLEEAYNLNVLHIDRLAMELPYVYVIGDADYDYKTTILDATVIQRLLAGMDEYKEVVCVSRPEDKDRDGNVTILDATTIQLEIAGLS